MPRIVARLSKVDFVLQALLGGIVKIDKTLAKVRARFCARESGHRGSAMPDLRYNPMLMGELIDHIRSREGSWFVDIPAAWLP